MSIPQPANWYPDPNNGSQLRYWDGNQWTDHYAPIAQVSQKGQEQGQNAIEKDYKSLSKEVDQLIKDRDLLHEEIRVLKSQLLETNDEILLQEIGVYNYRHPLATSIEYMNRIKEMRERVKEYVKADAAVHPHRNQITWTVNGSHKQGIKMATETKKLMLRAYNGIADSIVQKVKPSNIVSSIERLTKTKETIARLGSTMGIQITHDYHMLRVYEIEITADYRLKLEVEREHEREERARLREEEKLEREIERAKEKERKHFESVIQELKDQGDEAGVLEQQKAYEAALAELDERLANKSLGYVYIISNLGSFGERMIKIGLTRRLEPRDRVRELGDASVPFRFDTHALIFSKNAVKLEKRLHGMFADKRVNRINQRREFFYATPIEVRDALEKIKLEDPVLAGDIINFDEQIEAEEFRMSSNQN